MMTGFSLSTTVTEKLHEDVFPTASVAVKVLIVGIVPTGKLNPLAMPAVCVITGEAVQLSVAVAAV